jgi:DNA-binding NarL/FixJ family response regulator
MNAPSSQSDNHIKRTRVLIADDHRAVNEVLKRILSTEFEVVGVVEDGLSLLSAAAALSPDVIVADISMPQMDGFSALQQLKGKNPDVKVILISMFREPAFVSIALEEGASGFVLKHSAYEELIPAIRAVINGQTYWSSALLNELSEKPRP